MDWTIIPPDANQLLHEEEQHFIVEPLDETGGLFTLRQSILAGPGGETRTITAQALHVAGCLHLVGYQPGELLGLCDLCGKWLCYQCANRIICLGCLKRLCIDCTKLVDGNRPYCPSCKRKELLKRIGAGLHRFLGREF